MSETSNDIQVANNDRHGVSLQVYQDIYNSITGKTEVLSRMFFDAHTTSLSDLERLHREFEVQLEQYDCKITNCHVSVRYCNGKAEGFSGFNRFKLDGTNKSTPTENIDIEYDFVVLLPKTKEAKPYKLIVGVRSTLGVVRRMDETKATEAERGLFFNLDRGTARIELHYVDLAVARTLEALVEDWYRSLQKHDSEARRKVLDFAASTAPVLSRLTVIGCSAVLASFLLTGNIGSRSELFSSGLSAGAALMMAGVISIPLANYLHKQVVRARAHSIIQLGEADRRLTTQSRQGAVKKFGMTVLSWVGAVSLGLLTTYIATQIGL